MEKYSKFICEYGVGKKKNKNISKKTTFHACLWAWGKHIPIWNYPSDNLLFMEP
jgi:hypothetical protein